MDWSFALSKYSLFLYSLFSFTATNCLLFVAPTKCHEHESRALLQFKESFVISKSSSYNLFSYPKMASWNAAIDCCSWDGIECDEHTNHVINIDLSSSHIYGTMDANSTLFRLKHLQSLDLADNHFNYSQIPSRIGELSQLRYLNLSQTYFSGEIPQQVSRLSKLLSLDLCGASDSLVPVNLLSLKISTLRSLIQNSTNLEVFRVNYVTISSSVPHTFTNLTSLQQVSLYHCELHGQFLPGIFHLPNLRYLNLGNNQNLTGTFPDFRSSAQITTLELDSTSFYGTLPASIGNLNSLNCLSISYSNFSGSIPSSFRNLTQLTFLDIGGNKFRGDLSSFLLNVTKLRTLRVGFNEFTTETISWICKLSGLNDLRLEFVNIGHEIPFCFTNLTQLSILSLYQNNLSGPIPSWIMNLTNLASLDLGKNNLRGEIPISLFELENLETVSVISNLLKGELELDKFLKLKRLVLVELCFNKLSLISGKNPSNASLSKIQGLGLGLSNLSEFPLFIRDLAELSHIYMPYNNVSSFPSWIWRKTSLRSLIVSYNSLIGKIDPQICNLNSLVLLDLSFNSLSGRVPSCLGSSSKLLQILVLNGNKLTGSFPETYTKTSDLRMIDLSNNNLQGQLPRALLNIRMLEYIDVSHNQINDSFPCWLGTLPELKVVALHHNHLYGSIGCPTSCTFTKLHIIDLSHNQLSGSLPSKTIQNWKSMEASNENQLQYEYYTVFDYHMLARFSSLKDGSYGYSFALCNKGTTLVYEKLQEFYNLIVINLSGNKFSGEIPNVIGNLTGLVLLNLSNNMLSGNIPSSLGKLSNLETLDLSLNALSGKIPLQLQELTFLSHFNVSFNNLSGPIPQNMQFATFQDSSFEGNQELCVNPSINKCEEDGELPFVPPSTSDDDINSGIFIEFDWKVVLIGYGGGLLVGLALGSSFNRQILAWLKRVC
ncbi:receptor-like protein 7 [Vigna unguiculata]|uniref:receptor-like protein 7 n=1 Tax=Vigna unguiculata TaxID=3917 RepID=UPI001017037A|nr:receptor-like protein 7 [Vigna unguiculata]